MLPALRRAFLSLCLISIALPAAVAEARSPTVRGKSAPSATASATSQKAPAPLPFVEGSWTLAVLPDTQNYSAKHPEIFAAQTRWIAEQKKKRRIAFVLQEGDIVNANTRDQWKNARAAMSVLDGVVPYAIALGNHDCGSTAGRGPRATLFNDFFPMRLVEKLPTFGGTFEPGRLENSYHLFRAGGRDWLVIVLEWAPRDAVIEWANQVLGTYPQRSAILVTHAYLYIDGTRYDHRTRPDQKWSPYRYGSTNDGEDLWQKLVSRHENVVFVFSGHVLGTGVGRLASKGVHGNIVHQIVANYQMRANGGEGYLRLLEFLPGGKTVQVKTYSPFLDRYITTPEQQFVLDLPPAPHP
jgi:hypothetical protein